ncbi:MAG: ATP-binding protein [Lautropia sp.]
MSEPSPPQPPTVPAPTAGRQDGTITLRHELLRLVLYAALPIVAVTLGLIAYLLSTQREVMRETIAQSARSIALAVDRESARAQTIAITLAASPLLDRMEGAADADDALRAFHTLAQRVVQSMPGLRVALVESDGTQRFNTDAAFGSALPRLFGTDTTSPANASRWRELFRSGKAHFSDVYRGALDGEPALAYRQPVVRDGHPVERAIAVAFEASELSAMLGRERFPEGWIVAVVDGKGMIIARNRDAARFVGRQASPSLREAMATTAPGSDPIPPVVVRDGTTVDGRPVFQASSRSPRTGWTVAVGAPSDVATAELMRSLGVWLAGVALLVALAVAMARRTWGAVGVPLQVIARNAGAFERGEAIEIPASRVREVRDCARAWSLAVQADNERRAQQALRVAAEARQAEMEQANREKDRVLAALGHELRNPLAAIGSGVQVLQALGARAAPDDARQDGDTGAPAGAADTDRGGVPAGHATKVAEIVAILDRQTRHLARLLDDMLDLARATFGKMHIVTAPVDLHELARHTLAAYDPRKHAIATIHLTGGPAWVDGDATRLGQVIRNLLDNAIKFTAPDGRIELHAGPEGEDAVIEVDDDGAGIAPEIADRVFDAFVQDKQSFDRSQGGLGLGLALVRQIVSLHQGDVRLESAGPGKGTRVIVTLPRRAAPVSSGTMPDEKASPGRHRVLVVEDQPDLRESLVALLELKGQQVRSAGDARSALEIVAHWRPDTMIIDIGLPDIDGRELAQRVRANPAYAAMRLVAMTGFAEREDRALAYASGFDEFLVKPVPGEALLRAIDGDSSTPST